MFRTQSLCCVICCPSLSDDLSTGSHPDKTEQLGDETKPQRHETTIPQILKGKERRPLSMLTSGVSIKATTNQHIRGLMAQTGKKLMPVVAAKNCYLCCKHSAIPSLFACFLAVLIPSEIPSRVLSLCRLLSSQRECFFSFRLSVFPCFVC